MNKAVQTNLFEDIESGVDAKNNMVQPDNIKPIALTEEESIKLKTEVSDYVCSLVGRENVILEDTLTLPSGSELDIYVPSCNYAVEFNGLYFANELYKGKKDHLSLTLECEKNGIRLFHLFEDEWRDNQNVVKSMLANALHKNANKIFARKCKIREVPQCEAKLFINESHIQGYCNSSYRYGLYYNDELVSIMTFGKHRFRKKQHDNDIYELLRFCNKKGTSVVGGAGKLLSHFIKTFKPSKIISYADRRYSVGNLYEKLGFSKYNESEPSYFYVIDGERHYRFTYRKDVLISKYGCTEEETEHGFCLKNKWYRVYDCGCLCYDMIFNKEAENKEQINNVNEQKEDKG